MEVAARTGDVPAAIEEDTPDGVVESIITEQDVVQYVELSGDRNRIHTDDAFAKTQGYRKGAIAHGGLVFSRVSAALTEILGDGIAPAMIETTVFRRPVYVGSSIRCLVFIREHDDSHPRRTSWVVDVNVHVANTLVLAMKDIAVSRRK